MDLQQFARHEVANHIPSSLQDMASLAIYLSFDARMSRDAANDRVAYLWETHGPMLQQMIVNLRSGSLSSREAGEMLKRFIEHEGLQEAASYLSHRIHRTRNQVADRIRFAQMDTESRRSFCRDLAKQRIEVNSQQGMTRVLLLHLVEHEGEVVSDEALKEVISKPAWRHSSTKPYTLIHQWKQRNPSRAVFIIERVTGTGFRMKFTYQQDLHGVVLDGNEVVVEEVVAPVETVALEPELKKPEPLLESQPEVKDGPTKLPPFDFDPVKRAGYQTRIREWVSRRFMPNETEFKVLAHYFIQSFGKVITDEDILRFEKEKQASNPVLRIASKLHLLADLRKRYMDAPFVILVVEGGYQMVPIEMVKTLSSHGKSIFPPAPEVNAEVVNPKKDKVTQWVYGYPFGNNILLRKIFLFLAEQYPRKMSLTEVAEFLSHDAPSILASVQAHINQMKHKRLGQDFWLDLDIDTMAKNPAYSLRLMSLA